MYFMADQLGDDRRFRILTIVDSFTRESLGLYVAKNIKGDNVVDVLYKIIAQHGKPQKIQVANGSEFTSISMDLWAYLNKVELDFSRPDMPTDNAFTESFSNTLSKTESHSGGHSNVTLKIFRLRLSQSHWLFEL